MRAVSRYGATTLTGKTFGSELTPALWITASMRPSRFTWTATSRVASRSERSPATAPAPRSMRSRTAVSRSWFRAWTTTLCPCSSSVCAAARPRPSAEPVMKTRAARDGRELTRTPSLLAARGGASTSAFRRWSSARRRSTRTGRTWADRRRRSAPPAPRHRPRRSWRPRRPRRPGCDPAGAPGRCGTRRRTRRATSGRTVRRPRGSPRSSPACAVPRRPAVVVRPRAPARCRHGRAPRSSSLSWLDHHLDRLALGHRPVAVGDAVESDAPVEHLPRLDPPLEGVGQQLLDVGARGRRPATDRDVAEERGLGAGDLGVLRNADTADRPTGARDTDRRLHRCAVTDALQHGMGALTTGELADTLDGLLTALRDDVGRAELAGERDAVRVTAEDDDLLGTEPLGGDDGAEADGPVADDRGALAGCDPGDDGGVVAGAHDVRERQQRRQERVVLADRQRVERAVCVGHSHGLSLGCADAVVVEEAAVHARGVQTLAAEGAAAVRERERHHDGVPLLEAAKE